MTDSNKTNQAHKAVFVELVLMLGSSAMQQLGKLMNPMTGKTEVNLEAAQATIDLLDMLKAKTTGNLDRDEARLLSDTLASLQMNYVDTAQGQPAAAPSQPAQPDEAPTQDQQKPAAEAPPPAEPAEKKFHKTYE